MVIMKNTVNAKAAMVLVIIKIRCALAFASLVAHAKKITFEMEMVVVCTSNSA
jgi:hypothetical protein